MLPRVEMFREISEEEGNHPKVGEQCEQRCGGGHVQGMFMRWQAMIIVTSERFHAIGDVC